MEGYICPACGDDMKHWNQGIYECGDCNIMIDEEDLIDMY